MRNKTNRFKQAFIILCVLLSMLLASCEWGKCKNCNAAGTPMPTLAPAEQPPGW